MLSASGPLSRKAVPVTTQFSSIWRVGGFHFLPMGFFFISFFFFNCFSFPTLVYCLVSIYPQGVWKPQVSIIGFFLVYFLIFLVWEHVVRICAFVCWWGWRAVCQSDDVHKRHQEKCQLSLLSLYQRMNCLDLFTVVQTYWSMHIGGTEQVPSVWIRK